MWWQGKLCAGRLNSREIGICFPCRSFPRRSFPGLFLFWMQNYVQRDALGSHGLLNQPVEQLSLFIDLRRLNLNAVNSSR